MARAEKTYPAMMKEWGLFWEFVTGQPRPQASEQVSRTVRITKGAKGQRVGHSRKGGPCVQNTGKSCA